MQSGVTELGCGRGRFFFFFTPQFRGLSAPGDAEEFGKVMMKGKHVRRVLGVQEEGRKLRVCRGGVGLYPGDLKQKIKKRKKWDTKSQNAARLGAC